MLKVGRLNGPISMQDKDKPGIGSQSFYIKFDTNWCKKGDILTTSNNTKCRVIKVYKLNWWKRFLLWLGFSVKLYIVKVETNWVK